MSESREIKTMRYMAWERVKGELRAMLQTYYGNGKPESHPDYDNSYERAKKIIDPFIENFDNDCM